MLSLLQVFPILLVNIYTIWLLRWGYEIKTLAIESIVLCFVILALEIYEFVLHKQNEPQFMHVRDFFGAKGRKGAKGRINVMSGYDDDQDPDGSNAVNESQIRLSNAVKAKASEYLPSRGEESQVYGDITSQVNS